ncbi:MAG: SelB C-terminal domain-containing protein, partial [Actinomycetota bacterium]
PPPEAIAALLVDERGALPADEVLLATGAPAPAGTLLGGWAVAEPVRTAATGALTEALATFHREHALEEGMPLAGTRAAVAAALRPLHAPPAPDLIDGLIEAAEDVVRIASVVRLITHRVDLGERSEDVQRLRDAIGGDREASPPGVADLIAAGFPADLIEAAARAGDVVKIAPALVIHPGFVDRALAVVVDHAGEGVSVSALREALGTSRKFAVPLVEWMDAHGLTRREGDLRFPR